MAPRVLQRLRAVDFYKKIPSDLTETTLAGAVISVTAATLILLLLGLEMHSFLKTSTHTEMIVDRSAHGELLRVNFDLSFPRMSCEFATLDISDAMGLKRLNLTKTVRKVPLNDRLERVGLGLEDAAHHNPEYDEEHPGFQYENVDIATPLSGATFDATLAAYEVVVVNFFAPWCSWCQRLAPTWEAVTEAVHAKYPDAERRIRFAKVDCVAQAPLCRQHFISAFPSIRIFHKGSDEVVRMGHREHDAYYGDRTKEALTALADKLVPPTVGTPNLAARQLSTVRAATAASGCNFAGFIMVKKVPGTMHFVARAPGHSIDFLAQDLSHTVNHLYFGLAPSPKRRAALARLHPHGLAHDWSDKLRGRSFTNPSTGATYEHYAQVVLTTIEAGRGHDAYDAYEYTVQSHVYDAADHASVKVSYTMSPIQILVGEVRKPLFSFLISTCAVIGGVFTVAGIVDGITHSLHSMAKKVELGKQG
ncbi:Protein disulfide-isomerase 5-4 [Auxenochlorella protothecoides]|uniref:Protein disulfide-isomerase 5-4 n=1 Tax=Auxenochlorella protothecoides TaxID=3075 RepID=A0A087SLN9_AUXPR|nr:Protein disulfide-isomerase 5-4 [Auxenochlorella protothecoides]KFM26643.1 Protein disulfide-isomerase 5-4 [Auxenochlorella protothecoides]RMZ55932.1 hypothetical protein APUTEX25_004356 [Auxenochlorella protothecoides]|eukprot:RMZ55932.1 hypothetical protein APUTEX25_004356 [Auxenochlorella protothecoides]